MFPPEIHGFLCRSNRRVVKQEPFMGTSSKALARKLHVMAKAQHGCFTASQAVEVGYADSVHLYHVKTGTWIRVYRGVYRLAAMPETAASRCMAALLWTRDKNGVVQGALTPETAESLLSGQLTSCRPVRMVVNRGFRRSSRVPEGIEISVGTAFKHKTSKILGLLVLAEPKTKEKSAPVPARSGFEDINDYYDWLDYRNALCPAAD
ncbi:MAG TPA: type IV toxin-antitoxin system AbiEi family antitoxin domain-containing protein [Kiritimatiellia bacterium]|nr:type IV toxin-antitoxin system AbiEi family antitoxin domain-containing protein [Kiritimatiellia bacterium]